jgi:hypothetical protein
MSKDVASPPTDSQDETYEDVFQQLLDSEEGGGKLNSESNEDTAEAEESEDDDESTDSSYEEETDKSDETDNPKQSTPDGWEKRYKDLQSYADKRSNALSAENEELRQRLEALEKGTLKTEDSEPKTEDKPQGFDFQEYLKSLPEEDREMFEDNPTLAKVMTDITQKLAPKQAVDEATVAELVQKKFEERQAQELEAAREAEIERAKDTVRQAIPNVEDILDDREFQIWKADNQTRVTDILGRADSDAEGVISVIKYYQSINEMRDSKAKSRSSVAKATAKTPRGQNVKPTSKPNDDDYDAAFEYYAQER